MTSYDTPKHSETTRKTVWRKRLIDAPVTEHCGYTNKGKSFLPDSLTITWADLRYSNDVLLVEISGNILTKNGEPGKMPGGVRYGGGTGAALLSEIPDWLKDIVNDVIRGEVHGTVDEIEEVKPL